MTLAPPHIAIAILNYNGAKLLTTYLPSIMQLTYPNYSVWVIDNASTDNSEDVVKQQFTSVKWIQNGENAGFARGYNLGLKQIDAPYYLLLNSDVKLTENVLEPLMDTFLSHKNIAFVQPILRWDRHPEKFEYAGGAGGFIDQLGYPFCRGRVLSHLENDKGQYQQDCQVFWTSGACMLANADAYWACNGMYEYFFMHNEEIDLCWRAANMGYENWVASKATVYHLGGASLAAETKRKVYLNFRNNLVMLSRNMPFSQKLWVFPIRLALDKLAAIQYLIKGKPNLSMAIIHAWWSFLGWRIHKNEKPLKRGFKKLAGTYSGSLLWQYFIKGKKTFSQILPQHNMPLGNIK